MMWDEVGNIIRLVVNVYEIDEGGLFVDRIKLFNPSCRWLLGQVIKPPYSPSRYCSCSCSMVTPAGTEGWLERWNAVRTPNRHGLARYPVPSNLATSFLVWFLFSQSGLAECGSSDRVSYFKPMTIDPALF